MVDSIQVYLDQNCKVILAHLYSCVSLKASVQCSVFYFLGLKPKVKDHFPIFKISFTDSFFKLSHAVEI